MLGREDRVTYLGDTIGYLIGGFITTIIFLIVYELILYLVGRRIYWSGRFAVILLGIYMTALFSVTVSPTYGFNINIIWEKVNLLPGQAIRSLAVNPLNFWGNIALFMPLGFLAPMISRRLCRMKRIIMLGMGVSLLIELLQLFLSRGTDIDDLILNTIGTALGFILFALVIKGVPTLRRTTGIMIKASGKRSARDGMPVILLIASILFTVILTGFCIRNAYQEINLNHAEAKKLDSEIIKLIDDDLTGKEQRNENDLTAEENKESTANHDMDQKEISSAEDDDKASYDRTSGANDVDEIFEASDLFQDSTFEANSIFLMDANDGTVIYSKNSDEKIAPASTAKMLTALTVISVCDPQETVTVGDEINYVAADASRAGLRVGNVLTIKQLLEGLMLPSGNDAAYVLAVYTGRKIAEKPLLASKEAISLFLNKMNEAASEAGAKHTNILSPDGYDVEGQYTTAHDLARIAERVMNSDWAGYLLKKIVRQSSIRECFSDGTDITWHNSNQLLKPNSEFYYENAIGLKTGSTDQAGKCLVSAAEIKNKLYIAVVMGASDNGRYEDTIKLYKKLEEL
jgi:D-alanyl-D-alanine carboxypeptidase/glycopeptide antibiotics resistance protein